MKANGRWVALVAKWLVLVVSCAVATRLTWRFWPAPVPAAGPRVSSAEFCDPQTGMAQQPHPQPQGTVDMVTRLAALGKSADILENPFLADRRAEAMRGLLIMPQVLGAAEPQFRFGYANQLLWSGHPQEAIDQADLVEGVVNHRGGDPTEKEGILSAIRMFKAVAYMRLGEQDNCLANHNADSCIFPLQPDAFHKIPRGSSGAIVLLTQQLLLHPSDLSARWLLNIAYMTLGEYPDSVPVGYLIPPEAFKSDVEFPRWHDVAPNLGLDVDGLAGGCIVDDFDNDGFFDVVVSNWALDGQLRFFHNDGNGTFTERTHEAGLAGLTGGLNIQQTDYNNDGLLDIWVSRGAWLGKAGHIPPSLLRNNGDGTFTDVTAQAGLLYAHPSQATVWFDYDGDGFLDLFVGCESKDPDDPNRCLLYHNNGDGTFTECALPCGIDISGFVKGVTVSDYDHSGRPSLYLSMLGGQRNVLLHNDGPDSTGRWHFSNVTDRAGVPGNGGGFATWFFDYDNDGFDDLFVAGYTVDNPGEVAADYLGLPTKGARPVLYHNNGDGTFTDVTAAMHLDHVMPVMGSNFGDLDNDGWLDMYLGTGNPDFAMQVPHRMFRNAEGKLFQDVTTAGGFGELQKGHAVAFADINNSGQQDVFEVVGGAFAGDHYTSVLFLNPGNANHWIELKLEGTKSNREAIGARLKVTVATPKGPRSLYRTVNGGGSFGSNPLRQQIGLGDATSVTSVEVFWPRAGSHQIYTGFDLDRIYRVREGDAEPELWKLKSFKIDPNQPVKKHEGAGMIMP